MKIPATYGQKFISLFCIYVAFVIAGGLPRIGHLATAYLLIYAAILSQNLKAWPILLLISVPLFNLTPYSGRYAITEFDSLILLTFGIVWFTKKKLTYSNTQIELKLFFILICIAAISGFNALSSFPPAEDLYLTVYQQPQNIWRVGKSLLYALLLYLLIHNSDRKETGEIIRNFALGACASMLTLTLIIFWEKGVLYTIFSGAPLRSILGSALYFSIDFRPTALFSTMHTGGGSLDSYIAIMFILPTLLLYGKPSTRAKTIFLLALMSGLYCALATVSRTVIAATTMTTVIIVIFHIYDANKINELQTSFATKLASLSKIIALLTLWVISLIIVQPHMGTEGVLSLPTFTFALAISYYQLKAGRPYILGIVTVICSLLITEALFDRIDKGLSQAEVLHKGGILVGLIALNTLAFILKFNSYKQIKPLALPLFIFISAATFISMGFSSASLAKRLSEITKDTSGREQHWDTVISTGGTGFFNSLFGSGPGTMPLYYPLAYTGTDYFAVKQNDPASGILSVTGSAQTLIQRVKIKPEETYTVQTSIRTESTTGGILVAICNRNIIIQTTHNGSCTPSGLKIKKSKNWQDFTVTVSTKNLRNLGAFHTPTGFEVKFYNFKEPVEIRHIGLTDSSGNQILLNPGFESGLDSWFWASDFQHLGWHSKNAFLHQYYELGGLGLFLTLTLIISITLKTLINRKSLDSSIQILSYSLVTSFILLGSFITILDDPQIATFWYLGILICSLLISDKTIELPALESKTRPSFKIIAASLKAKTIHSLHSLHKQKKRLIPFLIITLIAIISTEFYVQHLYGTSTGQMLARVKSSKLETLKKEHPSLNFIWSVIELLAPNDDRLNFNNTAYTDQEFFWSKTGINNLAGPKKITDQSKFYIREVKVTNEKSLLTAINRAKPGDDIILAPGYYIIDKRYISINQPGTKTFPIRIRAKALNEVILDMTTNEGFLVSEPYWSFENLTINGACTKHYWCNHAFHVVGNAHHTEIKNNIIKNFNAHIKINGYKGTAYPDNGSIIYNRLINDMIRQTSDPVTPIDAVGVNNWLVKHNFIADFAKSLGTQVTYAAFFKGGGANNILTNNLIICEYKHSGGIRIGLSFGGGGTGHSLFRHTSHTYEHKNGIIRHNVISNCSNDVAIYLNKANLTEINGNFIIDSLGIDVRFKESSVLIKENTYSGRIRNRDEGITDLYNNNHHSLSVSNTNDWPNIRDQVQKTLTSP